MSISSYLRQNKYNIDKWDNNIYLFPFNEPIVDYITDNKELNATSNFIKNVGYRLYCDSVTFNSISSIDDRFSFDNTLTITLQETLDYPNYSILKYLMNNKLMVLFKNTSGDAFILNAEYPIDVTYSYQFSDSNINVMTITLKTLTNIPTINYNGEIKSESVLRDKSCRYLNNYISSLEMIETDKSSIMVNKNDFSIVITDDILKKIEFNPKSFTYTDSFDGNQYEQTLSFNIPMREYEYNFHYNLLEYINNKYYCLLKTTANTSIICGFGSGMFPSYTMQDNVITITLKAVCADYFTIVVENNNIDISTITKKYYNEVRGECIDDCYTLTLIEERDNDGVPTNNYYCLRGYENYYSDFNIVGTYDRYDTKFDIKLTKPNIDCSSDCYIKNIPSFIKFTLVNEKHCYLLDTNCSLFFEYDTSKIKVEFNEYSNELCITSLEYNVITQLKIVTSRGDIFYINISIGDVGDFENDFNRIYIWVEDSDICLNESQEINCTYEKQVDYNEFDKTTYMSDGDNRYYRINEYISPLCDGNWKFIGSKKGELIV